MGSSKKKAAGRLERASLLRAEFGEAFERALPERRRLGCAEDDLLDAFAALWTARRVARGVAEILPSEPPLDAFGLRMEMVV